MPEEPSLTLSAKAGKATLVWRVSVVAVIVTLGAIFFLYADRHNDGRYVSIEAYQKDRGNDKELRDLSSSGVNRRLDEQDKKLDDIARDVKELLKEARGK